MQMVFNYDVCTSENFAEILLQISWQQSESKNTLASTSHLIHYTHVQCKPIDYSS